MPLLVLIPEVMVSTLSSDYQRRREQLVVARALAVSLVCVFLASLFAANWLESWIVRRIIEGQVGIAEAVYLVLAVFLGLGFYTLVVARMTLHLTYRLERAGLAKTLTLVLLMLAYGFVLSKQQDIPVLLPLAAAKAFAVLLFFRFWDCQIRSLRLGNQGFQPSRYFLASWSAFMVCRWLFAACWLTSALGFALSLVSADPIIAMTGGESLMLLGGLYFLFRIFVRNPLAHPAW